MEPRLFEVLGGIDQIQIIARGPSVRERDRLSTQFGGGRWRKLKGIAMVRLVMTGEVLRAELHWYEAHGIGRRKIKIKRVIR
jgi:hypothetical protein